MIPIVDMLGHRFGRRPIYMILSGLTIVFAFPMLLMVTSGNTAVMSWR